MKCGFILLLLLAACAPQEPVYRPVTVPMPAAAPPCAAATIPSPAPPLATLPSNVSLFRKVQTMLIELDLRKSYETQLLAQLAGCG